MQSNIISLSGVQCSGKTTVAQHLKRLIPESVIYDGKREFKRYVNNQHKKGIVIISPTLRTCFDTFWYFTTNPRHERIRTG